MRYRSTRGDSSSKRAHILVPVATLPSGDSIGATGRRRELIEDV